MSTEAVRRPHVRAEGGAPVAWRLVLVAAAAKVAFQLATANLYGAHRDEFYYLASGQHLAWGYVDNPPLVPWLYRLQELAFGNSVLALAIVPALLGGAYVIIAAGMTADLGGARPAQALAVAVAWLGPLYLTASHFLSTSSLDVLWWALATWLVVRLVRSGDRRWWMAVGAVVGAGLLSKDTIVVWAAAAALGLLATPQRTLLRSRWLLGGVGVAVAMVTPNLAWQVSQHWPTLQFVRDLRSENAATNVQQFIPLQAAMITLAGTAVWLVALRTLWHGPRRRQQRWLAHAYAAAFLLFFLSFGKAYYLGSAYLPLVAVGAVAVERSWPTRGRRYLVAAVLGTGLITAPLFTPILPASAAVSTGIATANADLGGMLGWPQVVGQVATVLHHLPMAQQSSAVIFTANYSEAGAVDFYGREIGLPSAISGQNTFWLWGYGSPAPGATVVAVGLASTFVHRYWSSVTLAARLNAQAGPIDPHELGAPIWVCRGQRLPWAQLWPAARHYG